MSETDQTGPAWFIDLDWYRAKDRSFTEIALRSVCPDCRGQLKPNASEAAIISVIRDCCSEKPDFITPELPVLESVFRVILANGNQPLAIEELSKRLGERLGGDSYRTSPKMLSRILEKDDFYGFSQVPC